MEQNNQFSLPLTEIAEHRAHLIRKLKINPHVIVSQTQVAFICCPDIICYFIKQRRANYVFGHMDAHDVLYHWVAAVIAAEVGSHQAFGVWARFYSYVRDSRNPGYQQFFIIRRMDLTTLIRKKV